MSLQVRDSLGTLYQVAGSPSVDSILSSTSKNPPMNKVVYQALQTKIERTVNDLLYYYTKSQTYSKAEVDDIVSSINTLTIKVVAALPTTDISTTTLYFVGPQIGSNIYEQFVYVEGAWVSLGSTEVDLSDYVTNDDLDDALAEIALGDLVDITITDAVDGQILTYDAENNRWINKNNEAIITALDDIEDVDLTDIQDGQTIIWDAMNNKWINGKVKTYSAGYGINISSEDVIDNKTFIGTKAEWDNLTELEQNSYDTRCITDDYADLNEVNIAYVDALPQSGIQDVVYGLVNYHKDSATTADGFLDHNSTFTKTAGTGGTYVYTASNIQGSVDDVHYKDFTSLAFDGTKFILTNYDETQYEIAIGSTFYWRTPTDSVYYAGRKTDQTLKPLGSGGGGGAGGSAIRVLTNDQTLYGKIVTASGSLFTNSAVFSDSGEAIIEGVLEIGDITIHIDNGSVQKDYLMTLDSYSYYEITVASDFDYKTWCSYGDINPSFYSSLEDVLEDEKAVRQLMLKHASADYLVESIIVDLSIFESFLTNDLAMKWIGLCDYVCDKLVAIDGVETELLNSDYWERYLKDKVPLMTSNTSPYGTASASRQETSGTYAFKAFDRDNVSMWSSYATSGNTNQWVQYQFASPIKVKRVGIQPLYDQGLRIKNFKIQASANGTDNFVDIYTGLFDNDPEKGTKLTYIDIDNDDYYMTYRLYVIDQYFTSGGIKVIEVQFYGRSLNVSVPVMTSDTTPYGECSTSSVFTSTYHAWDVFKNATSGASWISQTGKVEDEYVAYDFKKSVNIKYAMVTCTYNNANPSSGTIKIVTKDGDVIAQQTFASRNFGTLLFDAKNNTKPSNEIRAMFDNCASASYVALTNVKFYGVDYSEKEFEQNTTKEWLYDHGVKIVDYDAIGNFTVTYNESDILLSSAASSLGVLYKKNHTNLTDYTAIRVKVGDVVTDVSKCIIGSKPMKDNTVASTAEANLIVSNAPDNEGLNITSVNQYDYLFIAPANQSNANSIKITEWWIE